MRRRNIQMPRSLIGIFCVSSLKILGSQLPVSEHISNVMSSGAQTTYASRTSAHMACAVKLFISSLDQS